MISADVKDQKNLDQAMAGTDIVYHLASNPDIARAAVEPDIDFWEGTYLTNNILEAARKNRIKYLLYASGSGLYGDMGAKAAQEDQGPLLPISTYGASKLAGEAMLCAYCHMADMSASAFRFANVVGPHQTHGVGYDFIRKLLKNPKRLEILGDGLQSKLYIDVQDVITAMRLVEKQQSKGFSYYNVSTEDPLSVQEIAEIVIACLGFSGVEYCFTGGERGWKGDVPVVRLDSTKLRRLGWSNQLSSAEAIRNSVSSLLADAKAGKFGWEKEP
jgi:UDP-glucose 4-epimerase